MATTSAPARLASATADETGRVIDRYVAGKLSPAKLHSELQALLTDAHTAAYMRGTADRLGVREGGALLKRNRLSRAERADIHAAVSQQDAYLNKFVDAIERGDLSSAQIRSRAAMYAGSVKATYYQALAPNLPFYPGDGQTACLTHCKCAWQQRGGAWYWTLGDGEHCPDCKRRADGNPYAA